MLPVLPPERDFVTFDAPQYTAPEPHELLPELTLSEEASAFIADANRRAASRNEPPPFVFFTQHDVMWEGCWTNISVLFRDVALGVLSELPFEANAPGVNAPFPTRGGAGIFGWLGCRCSWPCTQQCWYLGISCGLDKFGIAIAAILLLLLELAVLDGVVVTAFIGAVPYTSETWFEFLTADAPLTPRVGAALLSVAYVVILIGLCFFRKESFAYFRQRAGGRILLRSLCNQYETRSYAYCTMVFWSVLFEFDTVIIPAYFSFVLALLVVGAQSDPIAHAAVLFSAFVVVILLHRMTMFFAQLLACFDKPTLEAAARFVRGARVDRELDLFNYIYLWTTYLVFIVLLILFKLQMTCFYLWVIPIVMLWYMTAWLAIPYCLIGWPTCPEHTGPCLNVTSLVTSLLYVALFVGKCASFPLAAWRLAHSRAVGLTALHPVRTGLLAFSSLACVLQRCLAGSFTLQTQSCAHRWWECTT